MIGQYDTLLRHHRDWMATLEAKMAYQHRKELSESTFGIIKEQMGFTRFLLRGLHNIKSESLMVAITFNLRTLCRAWRLQWNKTRKERFAGVYNSVSKLFLMFMGYDSVEMSNIKVIVTY